MKLIKTLLLVATLVFFFNPPVLAVVDPCQFVLKEEWQDADTTSSFTADSGYTVCRVVIKAATNVIIFEENICVDGYCVEGINSQTTTVSEADPKHDISNVSWYVVEKPTAVTLTGVAVNNNLILLGLVILLSLILLVIKVK